MDIREMHWLMDMITHINVGLVVFDREGKVHVWNHFMENHSGHSSSEMKDGRSLFDEYPVFKMPWIQKKLDSVLLIENEVFIGWEQFPHLFDFAAYRPVTSQSEKMYQNINFNVLKSASGEASLISMMIYDVTDIAITKLALENSNNELEKLSTTDRLTGLYNRGHWQEQFVSAFSRHRRYKTTCSLIIFDIDHFKAVNDTYGHPAGDEVIKRVASLAKTCTRDCDVVGRYGGEEYTIILPETDAAGAQTLAERLRKQIEQETIEYGGDTLKITVSLGICELNAEIKDEAQWLEIADRALYQAKQGGRNCSRIAD